MAEPDPRAIRPLQAALALTALATLVVLVLVGLASCHHAGFE